MATTIRLRPGYGSRGFTLAELLVVVGTLGMLAAVALPALARAQEAGRRASCANNLRQVAMALLMYADEANGRFPPLQRVGEPGCLPGPLPPLMMRGASIYPEYVTDARVFLCPSDLRAHDAFDRGRWFLPDTAGANPSVFPCRIDDLSYHYIPWLLRTEWMHPDADQWPDNPFFTGFIDAIVNAGRADVSTSNWYFEDAAGTLQFVLPLQQGVERATVIDVNEPWRGRFSDTEIPVLFDNLSVNPLMYNHAPGGMNVLFLDGHVAFSYYPSHNPYPVSRSWAGLMAALESRRAAETGAR